MRTVSWRWSLMLALAGLTLFGGRISAIAADEDRGGPRDRLDRLEQRLNELAERQEQLMRRLGAPPQPQMPMHQPGPTPQPGPMPQLGQMAQPGMMPQAAPHAPVGAENHRDLGGVVRLMLLVGILCNILLSVWIFTDIRKRGEGSGIFIALALVAGIPAAIIYALVRIGDRKTSQPS